VFVDGAIYHVYNRIARAERTLAEEGEAARLVTLLKEVMARDDVTVLAWCVMSNHYHLALRTSATPLDRPMRSVQQRFTSNYNARHGVFGPLWQGRYRAKLVTNDRHASQLLAYIHLNPVVAGIVTDPADYEWSGHREIVARPRKPLINIDEVLRVFGGTRRTARARYVRSLKGTVEEEWAGEHPGRLPWWRFGRPPAREVEDPDMSGREKRRLHLARQSLERPRLSVDEYLQKGARILDVELQDLRGRGRAESTLRARELLAALGTERYGLRVNAIAKALNKHPVTASGWVMRGIRRRQEEPEFRSACEDLDRKLAGS
jgi:REP element-mobilizing transposase RayT